MIVDLVRNDLGAVAVTGSVEVPALNAVEEHPGLVHLVSTGAGPAAPGCRLGRPAGRVLPAGLGHRRAEVQRAARSGPRAGAARPLLRRGRLGRRRHAGGRPWPSASGRSGPPADRLHFGTGAGITWGSDPAREWDETELKAQRLLAVAAGRTEQMKVVGRRRASSRPTEARGLGVRPRADGRRRRVRDREGGRRRPVRADPAPRPAGVVGPRARPRPARRRPAARRRRRRPWQPTPTRSRPARCGCASPSPAAPARSARTGATRVRPWWSRSHR